MKSKFVALAALLSSTIATAAVAPSNLAMTECRLSKAAVGEQLKTLGNPVHSGEGDYEIDGYEIDSWAYPISAKPFGLTNTKITLVESDSDFAGYSFYIEMAVNESYEVAKAKLLAANGKSACKGDEATKPNRYCGIDRGAGALRLGVAELHTGAKILCSLS